MTPSMALDRAGRPGDLGQLLSPHRARAFLLDAGLGVHAVDLGYLRLKPGVGALVGMTLEGTGPDGVAARLPGYVRTFCGDQAAALAAKWERLRPVPTPLGPGVRLLPGGRSVLFLFPADARLRGLRSVASMDKLKRSLAEVHALGPAGCRVRGRGSRLAVLRYKPERRLVASADVELAGPDGWRGRRQVVLRHFGDATGAALHDRSRRLRAEVGHLVPRPLGSLLEGRLFVEEEVEGRGLAGAALAGAGDAAEAVVLALLRLHGSGVDLGPARPPAAALVSVAGGLGAVALVAPGLAPQVARVIALLSSRCPDAASSVPVHGDLHLDQVLVGRSGAVLVDFERAARGDPLLDVGGLVAHLRVLGHRQPASRPALGRFEARLVETYLAGAPRRRGADLGFAVACGLAQQALLACRQLEPGWPARAQVALEEAALAARDFRTLAA